jgi:hypothetical protein
MHPLRRLRESGNPTPAQVSELLAENIVFNSPILVRPIEGREVIAAIFAQSSATRGSGSYTAEFKLDERTTFLRWVGTMDGHKFESLDVIVDNEQGLIVHRSRISCRPMFGTTQRRSVTATGHFRIYECGVPICLACATDKAANFTARVRPYRLARRSRRT